MENQETSTDIVKDNEQMATTAVNGNQDIQCPNGQPKERAKIPTVVAILIYISSIFLMMGILSVICVPFFALNSLTTINILISQLMMTVSTLVATLIMMKYIDRKPFVEIGLSLTGRVKDIFWGMLVAIGINGMGFLIMLLTGAIAIESVGFDFGSLLVSFMFFILVSVNEEVMCRGYILRRMLDTRLNKFIALGISSLLFAAMHLLNPSVAVMPMINLFIAGILLGAAYIYTRNLWFPLSLHLFWNWMQGPVFGFEVSGLDELKGDVFNIIRPFDNLINGGKFGFEGSILCTLFCCTTIAAIILYYRRKTVA